MKRFSRQEILPGIKNGDEEVLVYLSRKYFPSARRLLRIRGFRDEETPGIFSEVLAMVYSVLQSQKSDHVDFETFFQNSLNDEIRKRKEISRKEPVLDFISSPAAIASQCVSILDEQAQKLLFSRMAEKLSYENIAERFHFSNAVIAQYEMNKAYNQLEGIVKLRMNISQN